MVFRQANVNWGSFVTIALLLCAFNACGQEATEQLAQSSIEPGKAVSLSYTVSLPDGEVVHSNADGYPIKYKQGEGNLLPALEAAVAGLSAGDKKSVTLAPEDVYGPIDPAAFRVVPLDKIPEGSRQVGAVFSQDGDRRSIRVVEIKEDTAVVDLNHPLAGKTLTYDIDILSVE
jgi:FKBP-type peptidyl-prolyl cis-trans isomerase SlyD